LKTDDENGEDDPENGQRNESNRANEHDQDHDVPV